MKLGLSQHVYIPATTRATLVELGAMPAFSINGERYTAPTKEMPGEVEWRVDYLKWTMRTLVHYISRRPRDEWHPTIEEVVREAVEIHLLSGVEARAVAQGAMFCLEGAEPAEVEMYAAEPALQDAGLSVEGEALNDSFERMVLEHGCKVEGQLQTFGSSLS